MVKKERICLSERVYVCMSVCVCVHLMGTEQETQCSEEGTVAASSGSHLLSCAVCTSVPPHRIQVSEVVLVCFKVLPITRGLSSAEQTWGLPVSTHCCG